MRRFLAVAAVAGLLELVLASSAPADIGVTLDRSSGRPGDRVGATSGAFYLSLYLAPAATVEDYRPCRGGRGVCLPSSVGPPSRAGWIWLGRFFPRRPSFHFRVPDVAPGVYRPVVYCPPCIKGPRGSLIPGEQLFRVR